MAGASPCPLLDKLPAELRNTIYELAFTTAHGSKNAINNAAAISIDLARHSPPTKDLLLTCRQVYKEASKIYKLAYRAYWTSNKFYLYRKRRTSHQDLRNIISSLHENDLQNITNLELIREVCESPPTSSYSYFKYQLLDTRGSWIGSLSTVLSFDITCMWQQDGVVRTILCRRSDVDEHLREALSWRMSIKQQMSFLLRTDKEQLLTVPMYSFMGVRTASLA